MHRLAARLTLIALLLTSLACSLFSPRPADSGSLGSVEGLWDDVPRMDGLEALDDDLPLFAQVLLRTLVRNLMGNGEGAGNWIAFHTDQTSADVEAYYAEDRMAEHDWQGSGQSTCTSGSDQGAEQIGVVCLYQKQVGNEFNALIIMTAADLRNGGNYIAFIRIEAEATPEPTP